MTGCAIRMQNVKGELASGTARNSVKETRCVSEICGKEVWCSSLHLALPCTSRKQHRCRPTNVLAPAEEEIVYSCQVLQEMGFGMTREMVGAITVDYLTTVGKDNSFNKKGKKEGNRKEREGQGQAKAEGSFKEGTSNSSVCLKAVTTLTTALSAVVYTLTQRCVNGLDVTHVTDGFTLNVDSEGCPGKQNSLHATYVKINTLNLTTMSSNNLYPTNVYNITISIFPGLHSSQHPSLVTCPKLGQSCGHTPVRVAGRRLSKQSVF